MTAFDADREPSGFSEGCLIAGRYRLQKELGRGSFGEVWSAEDRSRGRSVAVKLLFSHVDIDLARVEEEVHTLRQGLPGVVQLLDDGQDGDQRFLVMELVDGRPFPGRDVPCAWTEIREVVLSLVETLAWVHTAFVVHRDLKPANVLVTPGGRVHLLDFGVAYRRALLSEDTRDRVAMAGTPRYMAPEQLKRRPAGERSDLYAIGIMIYEALTGSIPYEDARPNLLHARINRPSPPLREVDPQVPEHVAKVVDRLLAIDPEARPASAFEVVADLRGEDPSEDPLFLWLGPRTGFLAAIQALRSGRSVDLVGPRGSGRTRWLRGLREPLSETAVVHWIEPVRRDGAAASEPLRDLRALSEELGLDPAAETGTLAGSLSARLKEALATGHTVLVDDFEELDPASQAILDAARAWGPVLRASRQPLSAEREPGGSIVLQIPPLTAVDLQPLFAGPDRLLHLREDAARILHRRTGGLPARVFREVAAWLRLGIARRTRNLLVIPRAILDQLDSSIFSTTMIATPAEESAPDAPRQPLPVDEATVRAAHATLAKTMPAGERGRFSHLWLSRSQDENAARELGREALTLATRLLHEARIGAAIAAIETGLHALQWMRAGPTPEGEGLFVLWAEAVLDDGTPGAADRLRQTVYKSAPWAGRDVIEALSRTFQVEAFSSSRAYDAARSIPPQTDDRLERLRVRALLRAMRLRLDDAAEEELLEDLMRSPAGQDGEIARWIRSALGRLRYRQGRFREAAGLHEAAALGGTALQRMSEKNAAAWALFEAFDFDRAAVLAGEALALAEEHRHAGHEAAAAWTLRSIAYRREDAGPPDMDLARAAPYAVDRQVQGVILCTEAAAAYRTGHPDALRLATQAHELLARIDQPRGALLARSLSVALGAAPEPDEIPTLQRKALTIQGAGIGLQALALLAQRGHVPPAGHEARIAELAAEIPRQSWGTRMDILSVGECLRDLGVSPEMVTLAGGLGSHLKTHLP